jgi:hypothetical protein
MALAGTAHAQTVARPATFNGSPIVLTGNDSLTISDPDYTIKNDITLRGNSTLIISDAALMHASDYSGQFSLNAYDNSTVIVERSTIRSSPWINWYFWDHSSLQMTDVVNAQSAIWITLANRATATVRNVSSFHGTATSLALVDVDGAGEAFIETGFPAGSTADVSFPSTVGSTPYVFVTDVEMPGQLKLANVGPIVWGIGIFPESDITIRDTRDVAIGFDLPRTYSGLTARFDNLGPKLYVDDSWSFADSRLRLVNTKVSGWYPYASGDNRLIVTNSDLADQSGSQDSATISVADSTMTYTVARQSVRIDITRSFINGDLTAKDNGIITITDSAVSGQLVREGNGLIVASGLFGLGKGFLGQLTGNRSEVISGRASIKGSYFGPGSYTPILRTDPNVIRLSPNQSYRLSFRYRILTAPSKGFGVQFLSGKALAAGNFLPDLTISGKDGETGTATLSTKLGPYDDYWAVWNIISTGALVIDDIQLVDVASGQVIASEGGETPIATENPQREAPASDPERKGGVGSIPAPGIHLRASPRP